MTPSRFRPFGGPRAGLAFSERLLVAVADNGGRERRVAELPEELLRPSPSQPNVRSVAELARLVSEALDALRARHAHVVVALPDLALTTAVLGGGGRLGDAEQLRQLSARLSYPVSEARADFWRPGGGHVLAAAVREAVVRQYEQALEAAEARISWVDGVSTARLPEWAELAPADEAPRAWVQLYRTHYAIAVLKGRALVDLRFKLRSSGDVETVAGELGRLSAVYEVPRFAALTLVGEDAALAAETLGGEESGVGPVDVEDETEERQLVASLRALLARGGRPS